MKRVDERDDAAAKFKTKSRSNSFLFIATLRAFHLFNWQIGVATTRARKNHATQHSHSHSHSATWTVASAITKWQSQLWFSQLVSFSRPFTHSIWLVQKERKKERHKTRHDKFSCSPPTRNKESDEKETKRKKERKFQMTTWRARQPAQTELCALPPGRSTHTRKRKERERDRQTVAPLVAAPSAHPSSSSSFLGKEKRREKNYDAKICGTCTALSRRRRRRRRAAPAAVVCVCVCYAHAVTSTSHRSFVRSFVHH